ncbi:ABC transporter substrate-binding protein [Paludicola sp. MB14-C6]|uniref:ABC transporter substrate-binding protein n=1 Tax=Paludihabitans sp. MB14-C6 TaxID=3070656 RepID=UPI0027DE7588|nr:ABC transporter substrate-binding protein [Paludicola sp. MB14-C6]WMJ22718.1 ABC transporter substrate-binding protein [Paludicola sp. MB14-C6]
MKKLISFSLVAVFLVTALFSCNGLKIKQTNKELTIYTNQNISELITDVVNSFSYQYNGVKLNIIDMSNLSEEEYNTKLSADISSGSGPDVILMDESFLQNRDIYKMMYSGVFADINDLFKTDKSYKPNMYNQQIINAGKLNKKQLIVPLSYNIPLLITTEGVAQRDNISLDKCKTDKGLIDTLIDNIDNSVIPKTDSLFTLHEIEGLKIIDYLKQETNLSKDQLKPSIELYKAMYNAGYLNNVDKYDSIGRWYESQNNKKYTFELYGIDKKVDSCDDVALAKTVMKEFDTPTMIPLVDSKGKINAKVNFAVGIRNNSANVQNAYHFIKMLLEQDYQSKNVVGIPVNNDSFGVKIQKNLLINNNSNSSCYFFRIKYLSESGESKGFMFPEDVPPMSSECFHEFINEYKQLTEKVAGAYFPTPISKGFYKYFIPYYIGETSYEDCIKKAEQELAIYISE